MSYEAGHSRNSIPFLRGERSRFSMFGEVALIILSVEIYMVEAVHPSRPDS